MGDITVMFNELHVIVNFCPTVPQSAVSVSISAVGNTIAGEMYEIVCEAVLEEGIQSTPVISWLNSGGGRLTSGSGISVGPQMATLLALEFSILTTSQSGKYTCQVTLYSLALQTPLTASASITLNVIGKFAVLILIKNTHNIVFCVQLMILLWLLQVHLKDQISMLQRLCHSPVRLVEELEYMSINGHQIVQEIAL